MRKRTLAPGDRMIAHEISTEEAEELLKAYYWRLFTEASAVRVDNDHRGCSTLEAITYGAIFLLAVIVGLFLILIKAA